VHLMRLQKLNKFFGRTGGMADGEDDHYSAGESPVSAGPFNTLPIGSNRDP
jgi:hypothetical protein